MRYTVLSSLKKTISLGLQLFIITIFIPSQVVALDFSPRKGQWAVPGSSAYTINNDPSIKYDEYIYGDVELAELVCDTFDDATFEAEFESFYASVNTCGTTTPPIETFVYKKSIRCLLTLKEGNGTAYQTPLSIVRARLCTNTEGKEEALNSPQKCACSISEDIPLPEKNLGNQCSVPSNPIMAGNPINIATGNKFQMETDYRSPNSPLVFNRYYNSAPNHFNQQAIWSHTYSRQLVQSQTGDLETIRVYRTDGRAVLFNWNTTTTSYDTLYTDEHLKLTRQVDANNTVTGWDFSDTNDTVEHYDAEGKLLTITTKDGLTQTLTYTLTTAQGGDDNPKTLDKVTDAFNRSLVLTYDSQQRLQTLTDPDNQQYSYIYNNNGLLSTVTYPDSTSDPSDNPTRIYHYEDSNFPDALTGVTDENGQRFATWTYDTEKRATSSEHNGGVERVDLDYSTAGTTLITDTHNQTRSYTFDVVQGTHKISTLDNPCTSCGSRSQSITFDTNGYRDEVTDFNGHTTDYDYNVQGLEVQRIEAKDTPQARRIVTQWEPGFRVQKEIKVYDNTGALVKTTTNVYDAQGRLKNRMIGTP